MLPHGSRAVLGGVAKRRHPSLAPDPVITEQILQRHRRISDLAAPPVLGVEVGIRLVAHG